MPMRTPIRIIEILADIFIVAIVFYPIAVIGGLMKVCEFGECGVVIDIFMRPAAFIGWMALAGGALMLIPAALIAVVVSIITKMRRYAQDGISLFHILYSIPVLTLVLFAILGLQIL